MKQRLIFLSLLLLQYMQASSSPLIKDDKRLTAPPPRIIRTCCFFGVDVKVAGLPFFKYSEITGRNLIGPHSYLGNKQEGNGIIYTLRGGFIDIGHLRDQADWTAFIYDLIKKNQLNGEAYLFHKLGYEGGPKTLKVALPKDLTDEDYMIIAGRIAYDISVWHEIGTWHGTSLVPLLPERFSAFSIEDGYSNLLGIKLGIQALKSKLPFEEAMTQLLNDQLDYLKALPEKYETYNAMMSVEGDWWSNRFRFPDARIIKKRQFNLYPCIEPILLPGYPVSHDEVQPLCIPDLPLKGDPNKYYRIEIELNAHFPNREVSWLSKNNRKINQKDFPMLIQYAIAENKKKYSALTYKESKSTLKVKEQIKGRL